MSKPNEKPAKMVALTIRLDAVTAYMLDMLATPAGGFVGAPRSAIIRALIRDRAAPLVEPTPAAPTKRDKTGGRR